MLKHLFFSQIQSTFGNKGTRSYVNRIHILHLLFFILSCLLTSALYAQEPQDSSHTMTLGYQGELFDAAQNPLDGAWTLQFSLYTVDEEGESIWEETHMDVLIEKGHFSVQLGTYTPFPSELIRENQ